jgi:hypothetical protein
MTDLHVCYTIGAALADHPTTTSIGIETERKSKATTMHDAGLLLINQTIRINNNNTASLSSTSEINSQEPFDDDARDALV